MHLSFLRCNRAISTCFAPYNVREKMPQKQQKLTNVAANSVRGGETGQFVSCSLSDEDKAEIKAHLFDDGAIVAFLTQALTGGYKVSLTWDERSECVAVFMTATKQGHPDKGWTLSARGPDVQKALTVLAYKHVELLREDWAEGKKSTQFGAWG